MLGREGIAGLQRPGAGFVERQCALASRCSRGARVADRAVDRLGEHWMLPGGYLKLYPTARYAHSAIDALFDALAKGAGGTIPPEAIERIEVLRDGASAVYGTDAIGGVINFILRSNFTGLRASGSVDKTQQKGGDIYKGSLVGGIGNKAALAFGLCVDQIE